MSSTHVFGRNCFRIAQPLLFRVDSPLSVTARSRLLLASLFTIGFNFMAALSRILLKYPISGYLSCCISMRGTYLRFIPKALLRWIHTSTRFPAFRLMSPHGSLMPSRARRTLQLNNLAKLSFEHPENFPGSTATSSRFAARLP